MKDLKQEDLITAKDGLIILERDFTQKGQDNRRSNFCWPRGRWLPRHHWGERNLPEKVLNADESALFWDKMPQRTFISKEEKWAAWLKGGSDRLTNSSVLCTCSWVSDQDCWLYKKTWTTTFFSGIGSTNVLSLKLGSYLASKGLPFKILLLLDSAPGHPESHEFTMKVLNWSSCHETQYF